MRYFCGSEMKVGDYNFLTKSTIFEAFASTANRGYLYVVSDHRENEGEILQRLPIDKAELKRALEETCRKFFGIQDGIEQVEE